SSLLDAWHSRTPFYQHSAVGDFSEIDANYRRLIGQLQPHAEGAKLLALLFSCGVQFVDVDHQIIEQHPHIVVQIPVQADRPDFLLAAAHAAASRGASRAGHAAAPVEIESTV